MNTKGIFSKNSDEWCTPIELFNNLNEIYNFDLDAAATENNALCRNYFTKENNGLDKDWNNYKSIWINPPYSNCYSWVKKAYETYKYYGTTIVLLLPVRTDTKWFHEFVYHKAYIYFIKGRLKFSGSKYGAPFPSMIVIYENKI